MTQVTIPYAWAPRDYQMEAWMALQNGCRRALLVWHRRAGKDLFALNWTAAAAMRRVGAYWHIFPTYRQGRKIAWEGTTRDGRPFKDHFPKEVIARERDGEMTLNFKNGSSWHVVGADNPDSQVGTNPVGMVFSEWAVMQDPQIWRYLQPILIENGGWALFVTTPRGRNHCYDMLRRWRDNPNCFVQVLGRKDTGAVTDEQIADAKAEGFSDDMVAQEFDCSFDAALHDAWFGVEMRRASDEGRIGHVPFDPKLPVETWWDLGWSDYNVVWLIQRAGPEIRALKCLYGNGMSLSHWVAELQKFAAEKGGVVWRYHLLPHDGNAHSLQTGKTNKKALQELGLSNVKVNRKAEFMAGIRETRALLARMWFDEGHCATGIEGLRQYRRKPLEGVEDPDHNQVYSNDPVHDWASHFADALRTGAMGGKDELRHPEGEKLYAPMAMV